MNSIQLIGRVTKDIELKQTKGGKAYCNFSIAVTRKYKREETDFINCLAWDKTAELIKNVKKGEKAEPSQLCEFIEKTYGMICQDVFLPTEK